MTVNLTTEVASPQWRPATVKDNKRVREMEADPRRKKCELERTQSSRSAKPAMRAVLQEHSFEMRNARHPLATCFRFHDLHKLLSGFGREACWLIGAGDVVNLPPRSRSKG